MAEKAEVLNNIHWKSFRTEICSRMFEPLNHPSYIFFFFLTVVVISPAGVWFELYRLLFSNPQPTADALFTAITTFSPALMTTSCLQVIWGKPLPSFRAFVIVISFLSGVGWFFCVMAPIEKSSSIWLGFFLSIIALWIWWMSNARQKELLDEVDTSAPIGGDNLSGRLSGEGELHDFKH